MERERQVMLAQKPCIYAAAHLHHSQEVPPPLASPPHKHAHRTTRQSTPDVSITIMPSVQYIWVQSGTSQRKVWTLCKPSVACHQGSFDSATITEPKKRNESNPSVPAVYCCVRKLYALHSQQTSTQQTYWTSVTKSTKHKATLRGDCIRYIPLHSKMALFRPGAG